MTNAHQQTIESLLSSGMRPREIQLNHPILQQLEEGFSLWPGWLRTNAVSVSSFASNYRVGDSTALVIKIAPKPN